MAAREIEYYVARAKGEPTTEHLQALWRAVFFLQGWYFLPSRSDEGEAFPTVTMVEDQAWVLIFTNVRRIKEFARTVGRAAPDGSVPILVLDPASAMDRILEADTHIAGAIFNLDADDMFRAPVEALEAYARHFGVPLSGA